jgi:WD40 repeat protein
MYHTATLLPNGQVLIAGGKSGAGFIMDSAELYDPSTGKYTAIVSQSMVSARYNQTATLLPNGKVLLAGGVDSSNGTLTSAELYDPATQSFTATTGSMTATGYNQTATLLSNGKVLIAGGMASNGDSIADAELYDPATDSFSSTGSMTAARYAHTATLLPNGKVLIAGGYDSLSSNYLNSAELYDPVAGSFSVTGSMGLGCMGHTATQLWNGTVLIAGGNSALGIASSAEIYDPTTAAFTAVSNAMNAARAGDGAVLLPNGHVLLVGGDGADANPLASAELYDPLAQTFTLVPTSMSVGRDGFTTTLLSNNKVLIAGGEDLTSGASSGARSGSGGSVKSKPAPMDSPSGTLDALSGSELYDPQDPPPQSFTSTGDMNYARIYHTATKLPNGKFLIAGGSDASLNNVTAAELYNPATGFFTLTGSITAKFRINSVSVALPNGKILLAGGDYGMNSAELYNPATGTFASTGSLAETRGRGQATATLLPNGKVLLTGGGTQNGEIGTAELYTPSTGTFAKTGSMQTCRAAHAATLLPNGEVLVTGGVDITCAGGEVQTMSGQTGELYNPDTGTFSTTGKMSIRRYNHSATLLPNGKVLIAGGESPDTGYEALVTAELYDPSTGAFTATGSMTIARTYHTATLLPNGKVLIVGGIGPSDPLSSTEIYDPSSGTFSAAGSLVTARGRHTALLLWNGKVMVAGGNPIHTSMSGAAMATAEISQ